MSLEYVLDNIWLKEHSITVKWIVLFHEDFEPEFNALREEVQDEMVMISKKVKIRMAK